MNLKIMDHFHEVISFTFELENKDQRYPFLSEAQVLCNLIVVTDSLKDIKLFRPYLRCLWIDLDDFTILPPRIFLNFK